MDNENVVETHGKHFADVISGDRFADVVEQAKLRESVAHVLHYAKDIADNDDGDIEAQHCVKVLESILSGTNEFIVDLIS